MRYKIGMIRRRPTACWTIRDDRARLIGRFASVELRAVSGIFRSVSLSGWFEVDGELTIEGDAAVITQSDGRQIEVDPPPAATSGT